MARISSKEEYLDRLNSLRGIFAIEIVIGHVIRYENTILYPLGKFMIVSVAFYFFISAWGMGFQQPKSPIILRDLFPQNRYIYFALQVSFLFLICL